MRTLDHAAIHAEYEELGQIVGQREYTLDYCERVADEQHVKRGQTKICGAEQQLEQYDVPVAFVQLVSVETQLTVKLCAVPQVVHQLLLGAPVGGLVVRNNVNRMLHIQG